MNKVNEQKKTNYGQVKTSKELGQIVRFTRKNQAISLETFSGIANLSLRFLSEFERGKETAEIGKALYAIEKLGLEVIILPRGEYQTLLKLKKINHLGDLKDD